MKKFIFFILALLCVFTNLFGQGTSITTKLLINDKVPDFEIRGIENYPANSALISDFKDKLLILDFWSTSCATCIKAFPKVREVQAALVDKVQFILVSLDFNDPNGTRLASLLKRMSQKGTPIDLPYVYMDTIVKNYFPLSIIPHYVWIQNNRVVATTDTYEITISKINAFLEKGIKPVMKVDRIAPDYSLSFKALAPEQEAISFSGASSLYGYLPGFPSQQRSVENDSTVRNLFINRPISQLLAASVDFPNNRLFFAPAIQRKMSTSMEKAEESSPEEWRRNYLYSYESVFFKNEDTLTNTYKEAMSRHLLAFFDLGYEVRKVAIPCYVIKIRDQKVLENRISKNQAAKFHTTHTDSSVQYCNVTIGHWVALKNIGISHNENTPFFIDETGWMQCIDISIPKSVGNDAEALNRTLAANGLYLEKQFRLIDAGYLFPTKK